MAIALPLMSLAHKSLITPPVLANGGEAANPAMNRQIKTPSIVGENPIGKLITHQMHQHTRYTGFLPNCSDRGATNGGPRANPST
jgi:hypothetical protein